MVKKKFVRKHQIRHTNVPKQHTNQGGILPSAYGSSTTPHPNAAPSTAGQFNPPGWNKTHDYGVQQTSPFMQGPPPAEGSPETKITGGFGIGTGNLYQPSTSGQPGQQPQVYNPSTGYMENAPPPTMVTKEAKVADKYTKPGPQPTWYASSSSGTWKGKGKLTLEARQYYKEHGVKITSKPPGQPAQQDLSDRYGITTYTRFGDVSTTQQSKFKQQQQRMSDKHGITTYNKDGSVSTTPSPWNLQRNLQPVSSERGFLDTFFRQPETASAHPDPQSTWGTSESTWVDHTTKKNEKPWWHW